MLPLSAGLLRSLRLQPVRPWPNYLLDPPHAAAATPPPVVDAADATDAAAVPTADDDAVFAAPRPAGLQDLPVELLQGISSMLPPGDFLALRSTSRHHHTCLSEPLLLAAQQKRTERLAQEYQRRLVSVKAPEAQLQLYAEIITFVASAWRFMGESTASKMVACDLWNDTLRVVRRLDASCFRSSGGPSADALRLIDALQTARDAPHFSIKHLGDQAGVFARTVARLLLEHALLGDRMELLKLLIPVFTAKAPLAAMGAFSNVSMLLEMADALPQEDREFVRAELAGPISRLQEPWKTIFDEDRSKPKTKFRFF